MMQPCCCKTGDGNDFKDPNAGLVMNPGPFAGIGPCGFQTEYSILSPKRSGCEYAQRRMWAAANEPRLQSTTTCGDIIKRLNSHRRTSSPSGRSQPIYLHCEGMIPNYQGHVPGAQFRIGVTYGTATRNAKSVIQPELLKPLCYPLRRKALFDGPSVRSNVVRSPKFSSCCS